LDNLKEPSPSASKVVAVHTLGSPTASLNNSQITAQTSTSRPEGWWSSDDVGNTEHEASHPTTPNRVIAKRRSFDSQASNGRQSRFGERGISLGSAKAVSGVVDGEGHGESGGSGGREGVKGNRLSIGSESSLKAKRYSVGSSVRHEDGADDENKKVKVKKRSGSGIPVLGSK
jgi:lysosomal acid lipase/cholesteryl ester hydrolase